MGHENFHTGTHANLVCMWIDVHKISCLTEYPEKYLLSGHLHETCGNSNYVWYGHGNSRHEQD